MSRRQAQNRASSFVKQKFHAATFFLESCARENQNKTRWRKPAKLAATKSPAERNARNADSAFVAGVFFTYTNLTPRTPTTEITSQSKPTNPPKAFEYPLARAKRTYELSRAPKTTTRIREPKTAHATIERKLRANRIGTRARTSPNRARIESERARDRDGARYARALFTRPRFARSLRRYAPRGR